MERVKREPDDAREPTDKVQREKHQRSGREGKPVGDSKPCNVPRAPR